MIKGAREALTDLSGNVEQWLGSSGGPQEVDHTHLHSVPGLRQQL